MSSPAQSTTRPRQGTTSFRTVLVPAPGRGEDLQLRVTAPVDGQDLPLVVFSHGYAFSMDGYAPLADRWATDGFVVVQPTHLDSASLGMAPGDARTARTWRYRIEDLTRVLDELDLIEAQVPGLAGRVDRSRVAVAGHSYGATTASALLGARVLGPESHDAETFADSRVTAGVLLSIPGTGGADLTPFAAQHFPFMHPDFAAMTTPALIVAGGNDQSPLSVRGPGWFTDAYALSPAGKALITLADAEHALGGVHAYGGMPHTPADNPAQVALVQEATSAYLRGALGLGDEAWTAVRSTLQNDADPLATLTTT